MTSRVNPGKGEIDGSSADSDRANNPSEPTDPQVLATAADEAVHQSRDFPSGGGEGGSGRGGTAAAPGGLGAGGTTGRGATTGGQTDRVGASGSGTAGAAGG